MIHNKLDEGEWTNDVNDWEEEFDDNDYVIADGYGSFREMIVVHEIDFDVPNDNVVHRGVFWKEEYAVDFAEVLNDGT